MAPTATGAERESVRGRTQLVRRRSVRRTLVCLAILASAAVAGCSSSAANSGLNLPMSSTTDPTAAVDAAILAAWRAAETAFYQAEANPQGLYSPALPATMMGSQLELVKTNLGGDEVDGFVGKGPWNLGNPRVVSLGPSENRPTTASVVSCIHDTQTLVNEHSGRPASGIAGSPDWIGATSTMALTQGWKLSQQAAVVNTSRSVACAGIAS